MACLCHLFWASLGSPWGVGLLRWVIASKVYFRPPQKTTTGTSNFQYGKLGHARIQPADLALLRESGAVVPLLLPAMVGERLARGIPASLLRSLLDFGRPCLCLFSRAAKTPIPPKGLRPETPFQLGYSDGGVKFQSAGGWRSEISVCRANPRNTPIEARKNTPFNWGIPEIQ